MLLSFESAHFFKTSPAEGKSPFYFVSRMVSFRLFSLRKVTFQLSQQSFYFSLALFSHIHISDLSLDVWRLYNSMLRSLASLRTVEVFKKRTRILIHLACQNVSEELSLLGHYWALVRYLRDLRRLGRRIFQALSSSRKTRFRLLTARRLSPV